jgi:diguanylate cyclase (GGDEF)-like protein/putative nucleotidyltransferase with HDIG domain
VLILFDLDGFKTYNDTFGHPAGDRLLAMIGDALAGAVGDSGTAFRMGGDEFCAIVDAGGESADDIARRLGSALVQSGQGFHVGASYGTVLLPDEATDSQEALRIADRRLYANKRGGRISAHRQSSDVLLAVLAERDPDLGAHVNHVADLAGEVARRFGLDDGEVEDIRRAAALHDIGKIAVPERILDKPAALDPDELALMRQHTVVGERVLSAAPALGAVARMVRSSHERWDGAGYPDGLAGAGIPLGARVIFVCDAFDAMTADRPYQAAMTPADALAELRRCAGTQFDPDVVEAFIATLNESGARMAMAGDHAG